MGMTRQLVYVKKKKNSGHSAAKRSKAISARSERTISREVPKPFNEVHAVAPAPLPSEDRPNWILLNILMIILIGLAVLPWIDIDDSFWSMKSLQSLPSQYPETWHGQDARQSGLEHEAATKRPPASEESFLATFSRRASQSH